MLNRIFYTVFGIKEVKISAGCRDASGGKPCRRIVNGPAARDFKEFQMEGKTGIYRNFQWRIIHNSVGWVPLVKYHDDWIRFCQKEFDDVEKAKEYLYGSLDKIFQRSMINEVAPHNPKHSPENNTIQSTDV
jgi:hypothetical protein